MLVNARLAADAVGATRNQAGRLLPARQDDAAKHERRADRMVGRELLAEESDRQQGAEQWYQVNEDAGATGTDGRYTAHPQRMSERRRKTPMKPIAIHAAKLVGKPAPRAACQPKTGSIHRVPAATEVV